MIAFFRKIDYDNNQRSSSATTQPRKTTSAGSCYFGHKQQGSILRQAIVPGKTKAGAFFAHRRAGVRIPLAAKGPDFGCCTWRRGIYGYPPPEVQRVIADRPGAPLAGVSGVVSFYFSFPPGAGAGIPSARAWAKARYVRGAASIVERLREAAQGRGGLPWPGWPVHAGGVARCSGAACGYVYVRAEYPLAVERLEQRHSSGRARTGC